MNSFIAIVVQTVKDHSLVWLSIATLTPVAYLLLKERKQGFIQKWIFRSLLKQQLKDQAIGKTKPGHRLLLSLLLGLGFGLLFTLVTAVPAAIAVGVGAFLLGMLVIFKSKHPHDPSVF